jgi:hypothetical protein
VRSRKARLKHEVGLAVYGKHDVFWNTAFFGNIFVLTTSKFPMAWKISKIVPTAKKNEPFTLSDYFPIRILPVVSKAMKVIVKW